MKPVKWFMVALAAVAFAAEAAESDMDRRIVNAFEKSYVRMTTLKDDAIDASSADGVVTLSGTVADARHMKLAEESVSELPGVMRVENLLKAGGEGSGQSETDAVLARSVRATLDAVPSLDPERLEIGVTNGVVTLSGDNYNEAQRELATICAKEVPGVKEVRNSMSVANPGENPLETAYTTLDDASITTRVKTLLLSHRSTSALKTNVKTSRGVVTIDGRAASDAERELVTKLASGVKGVLSVNNRMKVD